MTTAKITETPEVSEIDLKPEELEAQKLLDSNKGFEFAVNPDGVTSDGRRSFYGRHPLRK